jgi:hypothetical protein
MTLTIRFMQSGQFNAGELKSLDLEKITKLQINRLRNTCELHATTPENPRPNTPFLIASRERAYELQVIIDDLEQFRRTKKTGIYEITETESHLVL